MTEDEIKKELYHVKVWHRKLCKWIHPKEMENIQFAIFYGDDGGDCIIEECTTLEEFKKLATRHIIDGNTNCDYETRIYLIICNGKKYTPQLDFNNI